MATEKVLHMNGGEGETSYANNSSFQRKVIMKVKPILQEHITKVYSNIFPDCFKVADLGCSSGPNTFLTASEIMSNIDSLSCSLKLQPPSFQISLNDLPGNDFNNIFKSLPDFYKKLHQEKGEKFGPCFIVGVPGSFYGRLFPNNSMHFFHSSSSLHWLSQAPKWRNGKVKPLNYKENIYVTSIDPPAYVERFKEDFKLFLRSRSEELVPGGGMLLTFVGRYETSEVITGQGLIRMVLNDMFSENLVEEAKVNCFSIPLHLATAQEVREIIKEEGSFSVERLESIKTSWDGSSLDEDGGDSFVDDNERGEFITKYFRAVFEPLLKEHFGEGIMDELFLRFQNKVVQFIEKLEYPTLVMSLVKIA